MRFIVLIYLCCCLCACASLTQKSAKFGQHTKQNSIPHSPQQAKARAATVQLAANMEMMVLTGETFAYRCKKDQWPNLHTLRNFVAQARAEKMLVPGSEHFYIERLLSHHRQPLQISLRIPYKLRQISHLQFILLTIPVPSHAICQQKSQVKLDLHCRYPYHISSQKLLCRVRA